MTISRIAKIWRALFGSGLSKLEASHPEAMLDVEREELRRTVARYNHGLAGHAGLCERLKAEIARLEHEREQLAPKLQARLAAGDRATAGRYALRLEAIAAEVQRHATQCVESEATYHELVRARDVALVAARDKLETLKRSIGDLRIQGALAELTELAAGMQGSIGLSDGTLERVQERVDDQRHFAAGRLRVARDAIDTSDVRAQAAEQHAQAQAALSRYESTARADTSST